MFGIGSGELAIILVFGFLLFGPDKLPQMGHTIGRALRQFRETQEKLTAVVQTEVVDPMAAAAQAPSKPKKSGADPSGATTDTDDLDADIADDAIPAARKKETFAERRARLAAEKAEQEAAASESAAADDGDAAASQQAESAAAASEQADAPEEPDIRTTADLYARRPHKKKAAGAPAVSAEGAEGTVAAAAAAGSDAPKASAAEGGER